MGMKIYKGDEDKEKDADRNAGYEVLKTTFTILGKTYTTAKTVWNYPAKKEKEHTEKYIAFEKEQLGAYKIQKKLYEDLIEQMDSLESITSAKDAASTLEEMALLLEKSTLGEGDYFMGVLSKYETELPMKDISYNTATSENKTTKRVFDHRMLIHDMMRPKAKADELVQKYQTTIEKIEAYPENKKAASSKHKAKLAKGAKDARNVAAAGGALYVGYRILRKFIPILP